MNEKLTKKEQIICMKIFNLEKEKIIVDNEDELNKFFGFDNAYKMKRDLK